MGEGGLPEILGRLGVVRDLGIRGTIMCMVRGSGETKHLVGLGQLRGRARKPCSGPPPWT